MAARRGRRRRRERSASWDGEDEMKEMSRDGPPHNTCRPHRDGSPPFSFLSFFLPSPSPPLLLLSPCTALCHPLHTSSFLSFFFPSLPLSFFFSFFPPLLFSFPLTPLTAPAHASSTHTHQLSLSFFLLFKYCCEIDLRLVTESKREMKR